MKITDNMKIVIFGSTGMLGHYVKSYFEKLRYDVVTIDRNVLDVTNFDDNKLDNLMSHFNILSGDYVINCIGAIKPRVDELGDLNAVLVNTIFPMRLSNFCKNKELKMIHITTDCVYSGKEGGYSESSTHDIADTYGRTKSLGEPNNCMVLRTSIIGEEIKNNRSLVEWVKTKKNMTVNGFVNHFWNGVTCLQLSKIFEQIIEKDLYCEDKFHIHSPNVVNKFQLLSLINQIYNLNIKIIETTAVEKIDRTLKSEKNLKVLIPNLELQIKEMKNYILN